MSDTVKHKTPATQTIVASKVAGREWNDEHVFTGGVEGAVLCRTSGETDGVQWIRALVDGAVLTSDTFGNTTFRSDPTFSNINVLGLSSLEGVFIGSDDQGATIPFINFHSAINEDAYLIAVPPKGLGSVGYWNTTIESAVDSADSNRNTHIWRHGYNQDVHGAQQDVTEPAFYWEIDDGIGPAGSKKLKSSLKFVPIFGGSPNIPSELYMVIDDTSIYSAVQTYRVESLLIKDIFDNQAFQFDTSSGGILSVFGQIEAHIDLYVTNQFSIRQADSFGNPVGLIGMFGNALRLGNSIKIQWGDPEVNLGTGSNATLGKVGGTAGSAPQTATQSKWLRVVLDSGTTAFIPVWI